MSAAKRKRDAPCEGRPIIDRPVLSTWGRLLEGWVILAAMWPRSALRPRFASGPCAQVFRDHRHGSLKVFENINDRLGDLAVVTCGGSLLNV